MCHGTATLLSIQKFNTQTSVYQATVTGSLSTCSPDLPKPHS